VCAGAVLGVHVFALPPPLPPLLLLLLLLLL
jgi:hypothetical protein